MAQYVDVVPTLIEVAGGDPDQFTTGTKDAYGNTGFDGRSFMNVLTGKTNEFRDYVYGVQTTRGIIRGSESYPIRSVRSDKYLYIHNLNHKAEFTNVAKLHESWVNTGNEKDRERAEFYSKRPEIELYDVTKDPYQLSNIADKGGSEIIIKELQAELASFMKQQGDKGIETEMRAFERQPKRRNSKSNQ
jgi:N-sulfoglucosamine sulfohydrolase